MGGAELHTGDEDDRARNILLELLAAGVLANANFRVEFPGGQVEDLRATLGDLPPFAVECKRPRGLKNFLPNLKKLRKEQIPARRKAGYRHVLPIIGLDKALPLIPQGATVQQAVKLSQLRAELEIVQLKERGKLKLDPDEVPAIGLLIAGGTWFTPNHLWAGAAMAFWCLAPEHDERIRAIKATPRINLEALSPPDGSSGSPQR
jgi:hypothetical protein